MREDEKEPFRGIVGKIKTEWASWRWLFKDPTCSLFLGFVLGLLVALAIALEVSFFH